MSVASKTKTKTCTTVALGLLVALSALPTWANTSPGITPIATVNSVVSTQSNQDLSVLRTKLKERFSGVAQEVRLLIDGTTDSSDSLDESTPRIIDVSQGIGVRPAISRQDFFVDIENDPYKSYINRLGAYGVLSSSDKFYPQNYFRVDDFTSLFAKLYKKTTGNLLTSQDVLGVSSSDGIMTKWMFQQMLISLGIGSDIQIDGNPYDKLIRSEGAYYLVRVFDLPVLEIDGQHPTAGMNFFTDVANHPFASAISTLASLGIVTTKTTKFYPDNYLRHYDFVMIFVNALLYVKDQSLPLIYSSSFADVDASASYLSQLTYATDRGLIDDLITSKRGQLYFVPDEFISKYEMYQILSKTLGIQFTYNEQQSLQEKVSRAELAELLVDVFQLQPEVSESSSGTELDIDEMSLLTKFKTLLSLL